MSITRDQIATLPEIKQFFQKLLIVSPELVVISQYITALESCFAKTEVTDNQLTLLQAAIEKCLKKSTIHLLDFVIWDFVDNVNHPELKAKQMLNITEFILRIEGAVNALDYIKQIKRHDSVGQDTSSAEERKRFDEMLEVLRSYRWAGEQLISKKLEVLYILPEAMINMNCLMTTVRALKIIWYAEVYKHSGDHNIHLLIIEQFSKLQQIVDLAYDVFTIRTAYAEMKKSNKRWFSSKSVSLEKCEKLQYIEESFNYAVCLPGLIFDFPRFFHSLRPSLEQVSANIKSSMFGKSALSVKLDQMILRYGNDGYNSMKNVR